MWYLLVHNYNLRIFAKFVEVSGYSALCYITMCKWSPDIVISMDTRLQTGWFVVWILAGGREFLFSKTSRLAVGPTQPPVQWVPGLLSGNKAVRVWCCPFTSFQRNGWEWVKLYFCSPHMPSWHGQRWLYLLCNVSAWYLCHTEVTFHYELLIYGVHFLHLGELSLIYNLKRPRGNSKHRWDNNIKIDLPEVRWKRDWSGWGEGPVVSSFKYSNEPSGCITWLAEVLFYMKFIIVV